MQTRTTTRGLNKLEMQKKAKTIGVAVEDHKGEEIIGVNVLSMNELPESHPLAKRKAAADQEEVKKAVEPTTLPDPKKQKQSLKKASTHRDDGAFQTYIFRVHKHVAPDSAISKKAMVTLNHLVADKFEQILAEARELIVSTKKGTLTSKEVETACKLLIPGELGQNAIQQGRQALTKSHTNE